MEFLSDPETGLRPKHRSRYSWVELFSLSAVIHGLLAGSIAIAWIFLEKKGPQSNEGTALNAGNPTVGFWDEAPSNSTTRLTGEIKESGDLTPFTIQLSPVGMTAGPSREGPKSVVHQSLGNSGISPGANNPEGWFDSGLLPENVAWIVDSSLSMGINGHFETAGKQLILALERTSPDTKSRIWFFASSPREVCPLGGWVSMNPGRFGQLQTELATVKPSGNTDLGAALRAVLATGPGVIHVVTDEDQLTQKDLNSLFRLQARQAKPMPRIRVVVLTKPRQETPLQAWCRQAGCSYKVVERGSGESHSPQGAPPPRELSESTNRLPPPESLFPTRQSMPGGR